MPVLNFFFNLVLAIQHISRLCPEQLAEARRHTVCFISSAAPLPVKPLTLAILPSRLERLNDSTVANYADRVAVDSRLLLTLVYSVCARKQNVSRIKQHTHTHTLVVKKQSKFMEV